MASQAVASHHVELPPGFGAPFGQHSLQSAALQGIAAQPGSNSGAVMIQDHRQRQQQVAQSPRHLRHCVLIPVIACCLHNLESLVMFSVRL